MIVMSDGNDRVAESRVKRPLETCNDTSLAEVTVRASRLAAEATTLIAVRPTTWGQTPIDESGK
jgi:hypothetical protein